MSNSSYIYPNRVLLAPNEARWIHHYQQFHLDSEVSLQVDSEVVEMKEMIAISGRKALKDFIASLESET